MNFVSLPSGHIVNLDQVSIVKPEKEGGSVAVIFSAGTPVGNPPASHWLRSSFAGDDAAALLLGMDRVGINTTHLRATLNLTV